MNKVILMGRLTRDPEVRVSTGERQTNIGRFSIAVDRRFKREGQPDADFFNCTCFGRQAEFVEKYSAIISPIDDQRSNKEYRRKVAMNICAKFIDQVTEAAK